MWVLYAAKIWQFLLSPQPPLVFIARGNTVLSSGARTMGCAFWPGVGITHSQGIPHHFYPAHMNAGPTVPLLLPFCPIPPICPISETLPFLPIWMDMASLNPWLLDFHTAWFSDSFGCCFWDLVLILSIVEWAGEESLPMFPSWLKVGGSQLIYFYNLCFSTEISYPFIHFKHIFLFLYFLEHSYYAALKSLFASSNMSPWHLSPWLYFSWERMLFSYMPVYQLPSNCILNIVPGIL